MKLTPHLIFIVAIVVLLQPNHIKCKRKREGGRILNHLIQCCCSANKYKELYKNLQRKTQNCENGLRSRTILFNKMKRVLNELPPRIRIRAPKIKPPSVKQLRNARDRVIAVLKKLSFTNKKKPATFTTTTTMLPYNTRVTKKKSFRKKKRFFTATPSLKHTIGTTPAAPRKSRKLRRQTLDLVKTVDELCTTNSTLVLATINNVPERTRVTPINSIQSLSKIDDTLVQSCAECHYQITLPEGHFPREHRHVTCPTTKPNCFGGFGRCANSELTHTIFKEIADSSQQFSGDSEIKITFNLACSCQLLTTWISIGDGN